MDINYYFGIVDKAFASQDHAVIDSEIKRAIKEAKENEGPLSSAYASMLSELGGYYRGLGRYQDAVAYLTESANVLKKSEGPLSANYATAVNNRAGTYRLMGDFASAKEGFAECLGIYEESLGKGHILYASALNNLALVALDEGDLSRAAELLGSASKILSALPDHPFEYATSLANEAELLRRLGRLDEAEKRLITARDVYDNVLCNTFTAHYHSLLNSLGLICMEEGRLEEAVKYFETALVYCEKYYNREHREYKAAERNLEDAKKLLSQKQ